MTEPTLKDLVHAQQEVLEALIEGHRYIVNAVDELFAVLTPNMNNGYLEVKIEEKAPGKRGKKPLTGMALETRIETFLEKHPKSTLRQIMIGLHDDPDSNAVKQRYRMALNHLKERNRTAATNTGEAGNAFLWSAIP